jgi:uncharacterized protein
MLEAKLKAEDFVSVLNQKIGKAIVISDNSSTYYPQPINRKVYMAAMSEDISESKETLAIGEIEIQVNVSVSFMLD